MRIVYVKLRRTASSDSLVGGAILLQAIVLCSDVSLIQCVMQMFVPLGRYVSDILIMLIKSDLDMWMC